MTYNGGAFPSVGQHCSPPLPNRLHHEACRDQKLLRPLLHQHYWNSAHRLKVLGGRRGRWVHSCTLLFLRKLEWKIQPQQSERDFSDVQLQHWRSCVGGRLAHEVSWQWRDCSDKWQVHFLAGVFWAGGLASDTPLAMARQPCDAHVPDPTDLHLKWFTS